METSLVGPLLDIQDREPYQGLQWTRAATTGSGTYACTVIKGTGAYKHDFGTGTVDLSLQDRSFTMTFHGKPNIH